MERLEAHQLKTYYKYEQKHSNKPMRISGTLQHCEGQARLSG